MPGNPRHGEGTGSHGAIAGGSARGDLLVRVYVIDKGYQPTEVQLPQVASQFVAWLANDANPVLNAIIQGWLWQPADLGGLGALAESAWDIALLRAEVTATWQPPELASDAETPARP